MLGLFCLLLLLPFAFVEMSFVEMSDRVFRRVLDIIHAQEHSKDLHEQFHSQLDRAQDGFSVVAEYFSRGVFNKVHY